MQNTCKNCDQPVIDKYCPHCGQKTATTRLSSAHLFEEVLHGIFHIDSGILFTAKQLFLRPGQMLRDYLAGKRIRYFNPFTFCLIIGGINAILLMQIHWKGFFADVGLFGKYALNEAVWNSSLEHFAFRVILSVPVYSLVTFLSYPRSNYNFTEHLIANTFLRGEFWLFMIILQPLAFLLPDKGAGTLVRLLFLFILLLYMAWSFKGLFAPAGNKPISFLKAFFVAMLAISIDMTVMQMIIARNMF